MDFQDEKAQEETPSEPKPPNILVTSWCGIQSAISSFFSWCDTHGPSITALATVVLAVITFLYLGETRQQRRILHMQFVSENTPNIQINSPANFSVDQDVVKTGVSILNVGGEARDINITFVVICCYSIKILPTHTNKFNFYGTFAYFPNIVRNVPHNVSFGITQNMKDIKEAIQDRNSELQIHSYVHVTYQKHDLFHGEKKEIVKHSMSSWWNPVYRRWMVLGEDPHKHIESVLSSKEKISKLLSN